MQPLPLATLPTPVEPAPGLGRGIWVKRDDRTAPDHGGNKIRKLAYLLAEHDGRPLATIGPTGSNWLLAAALVCRRLELPLVAIQFPVPRYPGSAEKDALLAQHARVVSAGSVAGAALQAASLVRSGSRLLAAGGSDAAGTLAYVAAAQELAAQVAAGELPEPDTLYVAYGSGGTAVGLALGLELAGLATRVRAVRVTDRAIANPLLAGRLARGALRLIGRADDPAALLRARMEWIHDQFGGGYARCTRASLAAVERAAAAGLQLEPVYTGKALAALLAAHRRGRAGRTSLFWLTYAGAPESTSHMLQQVWYHRPSLSPLKDVLIVCSANMCRSPMAHAILERLARRRGLDELVVRSAGTMGFEGAEPIENARVVCAEHDLMLDEFRSSALTREGIEQADQVLVMENSHYQRVLQLADGLPLEGKLHMLSAFHPDRNLAREIPDPVGLRIEQFRSCYAVLEACLGGFLDSVASRR